MGLEAKCEARVRGRWQEGLARLEEKELVFRGEVRVRAPFDGIQDVRARDGVLAFRYGGEELALRLGAQAGKWAERILHPPSRLDKLGVKPGQRVCVVGLDDPAFLRELTLRGAIATSNRTVEGADMVFLHCPTRADLRRLPAVARAMDAAGAIWVLWPKGIKEIGEQDIRDVMDGPGLVDVKVVSFSAVLSGLKLMIRRERRPAAKTAARRRA